MVKREVGKPWTTKQLAAAVGLDESHIQLLLSEGKLIGFKMGDTWFIADAAAQRFIKERQAR
jgi:hypothetical protein